MSSRRKFASGEQGHVAEHNRLLGLADDVTMYGAVGDGEVNDTAAIVAALSVVPPGGTVLFPPGRYLVDVATLSVAADGVTLRSAGGADTAILVPSSTPTSDSYMIGIAADNVTVRDLGFEGTTNYVWMVKATAANVGLTVAGNIVTDACLLNTDLGDDYADASADGDVTMVRVVGNTVAISDEAEHAPATAVRLRFTFDAVVRDNTISGGHHGISWWGGNSNPVNDGAVANVRKCGHLRVSVNHVTDVSGAAIWGSMGRHVTVTGNTVARCGDVGIDFEGSHDCVASGNVVEDCVNGNVSLFFFCQNVAITGNALVAVNPETYGSTLLLVNNGATSGIVNRGVRIDGNTMECRSTTVMGSVTVQITSGYTISNNELVNVKIVAANSNSTRPLIVGNRLSFEFVAVAPFSAISTGRNDLSNGMFGSIVRDNTIWSVSAQPSGSIGVAVHEAGFNQNKVDYVIGNMILGSWPIGVAVSEDSSNAGRSFTFVVANNIIHATTPITETAGDTSGSTLTLVRYGNTNHVGEALN